MSETADEALERLRRIVRDYARIRDAAQYDSVRYLFRLRDAWERLLGEVGLNPSTLAEIGQTSQSADDE